MHVRTGGGGGGLSPSVTVCDEGGQNPPKIRDVIIERPLQFFHYYF